ncbi:MAG TPA: TIGR03118 family protein, partial [Nevskia sp.]|nr:TIGR03118 family protein [Nevskia sp.]
APQKAPENHDETDGAGLGLVDVYDADGHLLKRLVSGGRLNAPWGMALAPADFGQFSNTLLVGNFGDGTINAFDPASGAFLGKVSDASGKAIAYPGLWGIVFGNDIQQQPHNTLFFAAGINGEADGLYGRIDLVPAGGG